MNDDKKCDKYEAYFIFQDEESFNKHIENCPDCKKEHEKYLKVSELVKSVAPEYLKKQEKRKVSAVKKLACCFVAFVGFTVFTGYQIYDNYNMKNDLYDDSYISSMGLPTDDYGFLDL